MTGGRAKQDEWPVVHMLSGTDEVLCRCAERGAAVSRTFPGHSGQVAAARQVAGGPGARLAPSGRGLLLVERVAARWGYRGGPDGRVVWCELDRS